MRGKCSSRGNTSARVLPLPRLPWAIQSFFVRREVEQQVGPLFEPHAHKMRWKPNLQATSMMSNMHKKLIIKIWNSTRWLDPNKELQMHRDPEIKRRLFHYYLKNIYILEINSLFRSETIRVCSACRTRALFMARTRHALCDDLTSYDE